MLSTAYTAVKGLNPSADVRLFGQELMGQSYGVGLAEMLIKRQNADYFVQTDTLKEDAFPDIKMRFVLENPPFGTPWKGNHAKQGQEKAVESEYEKHLKGEKSRWPAGLPAGRDSQLLFMQSAIAKMDDEKGRAAIITNGSPLFNGEVSSGESQIRRYLLENDLIEAIIAMPTDMFYNTGIATYIWVLSKNKAKKRKGKIQLIDASAIYKPLRKSLGNKRREFSASDREEIVSLYVDFKENDLCQIYDNEEFIYKEYTVMEPLQRSYAINEKRIENLRMGGALSSFYDESKHQELKDKEESAEKLSQADKKNLKKYNANSYTYHKILELLSENKSDEKYMNKEDFTPVLEDILKDAVIKKKEFNKIIDGLSMMDKDADIEKDKKGKIIYDKDTKDTELVNVREDIDKYMEKEVLPHIPDARAFFEEDLILKNTRIKTGAEIPFTRYFYKYEAPRPSDELVKEFMDLENEVNKIVSSLFEEISND